MGEIAKEKLGPQVGWSERLKNAFGFRPSQQQPAAQRQVARLETVLNWCRSRQSPPHCLKCGSTSWDELDWTSDESASEGKVFVSLTRQFRHGCGGKLRHRADLGKLIHFRPMQLVLSSEGQLLFEREHDGNDALGDLLSDLGERKK